MSETEFRLFSVYKPLYILAVPHENDCYRNRCKNVNGCCGTAKHDKGKPAASAARVESDIYLTVSSSITSTAPCALFTPAESASERLAAPAASILKYTYASTVEVFISVFSHSEYYFFSEAEYCKGVGSYRRADYRTYVASPFSPVIFSAMTCAVFTEPDCFDEQAI